MFSPEEQRLGRAVNMSKQLLSNVVTTFQEVAKMDGKSPSLLEVSAEPIKQNSGWSTELVEMISKLTKNLEDLHDNSLISFEMCLFSLNKKELNLIINCFFKVWKNLKHLKNFNK